MLKIEIEHVRIIFSVQQNNNVSCLIFCINLILIYTFAIKIFLYIMLGIVSTEAKLSMKLVILKVILRLFRAKIPEVKRILGHGIERQINIIHLQSIPSVLHILIKCLNISNYPSTYIFSLKHYFLLKLPPGLIY